MNRYFGASLLVLVVMVGFVGCEPKGRAEKAGERVDEVIDNVKEGENPLKKKGAMEKMGESIDEATDGE
jgi:hypothetical protein